MAAVTASAPEARFFLTHRGAHLAAMAALMAVLTLTHYYQLLPLPHALHEFGEHAPYLSSHVVHEAVYLAVIAYAGFVFRLPGGIAAMAATLVASIPFIFAEYIDPLEAAEYGFAGPGRNFLEVVVLFLVGGWIVAINEFWGREHDRRMQAMAELEDAGRQLQFAGQMFEAAIQRLETANTQLRTSNKQVADLVEMVQQECSTVQDVPDNRLRERFEGFLQELHKVVGR